MQAEEGRCKQGTSGRRGGRNQAGLREGSHPKQHVCVGVGLGAAEVTQGREGEAK